MQCYFYYMHIYLLYVVGLDHTNIDLIFVIFSRSHPPKTFFNIHFLYNHFIYKGSTVIIGYNQWIFKNNQHLH